MQNINDGIFKEDKQIRSFLMIGQSNMAGRGEFADVPQIKNDRCCMLRMGRWQPMTEPVNVDRDILNIKYHSGVSLADQLPCCGVVNTQGLELKPDNLHFNAVSLRKLGVRYFEKYKEMTAENSI